MSDDKISLKEDAKQGEKAARRVLNEKGPQTLELIREALQEDHLTNEQRQDLERSASEIAGYLARSWLPQALWRKVIMSLSLGIGILGTLLWSPWFVLLVLHGGLFSPRIVGEVSVVIGKLSK
jgi:hypothetical protein